MYTQTSSAYNSIVEQSGGRTFIICLKSGNNVISTGSDATITAKLKKVSLHGASCDSGGINVGSACASYIDIEIEKSSYVFAGQEFEYKIGLAVNGSIEYCPMGFFKAEKPEETDYTVKVRAYDRMKLAERLYASELTYPTTTTAVMSEICSILGITLDTSITAKTLNNPNTVQSTDTELSNTVFDGYTIREAIAYIAGLYGKFAVFNRSGHLEFKWYTGTEYEVETSKCWAFDRDESDYSVDRIVGMKDRETTYSAGTGVSGISFENPFITQEIVTEIYNSIHGFEYRAGKVRFLGDPRLDSWDVISVEDLGGHVYNMPVMEITQEADGGLVTEASAYSDKDSGGVDSTFKSVTQRLVDKTVSDLMRVNQILANKASFGYLEAHYLSADSGVFAELAADVANINSLLAGRAGVGDLTSIHLTADNASIENSLIKSAMIESLAAAKITGLDINTTSVTVHSEDNQSVWEDNTIQMSDGTRVRIQLGKDANDDYNVYIWDEDGNLMFDALGITENGINRPVIRDDMVKSNANIAATKLDIDSLFDVINEDGSHSLTSAKIQMSDGGTLESTISSITDDIDQVEQDAVADVTTLYFLSTSLPDATIIDSAGNTLIDSGSNSMYMAAPTGASIPSKPTAHVTSESTDSDLWTKAFPTPVEGGVYYTCREIVSIDGTFSWTDVVAYDIANTVKTHSTAIEQNSEQIQLRVTASEFNTLQDTLAKSYAQKSDIDGVNTRIDDAIGTVNGDIQNLSDNQTSIQDIIARANDNIGSLSQVVGAQTTKFENIDRFFTFTDEGLVVSLAGSPMSLVITEDRILMKHNDTTLAQYTYQGFETDEGAVAKDLRVGNWQIKPRQNGNLSFVYSEKSQNGSGLMTFRR